MAKSKRGSKSSVTPELPEQKPGRDTRQHTRLVSMNRRVLLKSGAVISMAAVVPVGCGGSPEGSSPSLAPTPPDAATPPAPPTSPAKFLDDKQRDNLVALVDRFIPADVDPGAEIACCADFIDAYLAAFMTSPPFIYAGGPYSDRAGNATNDFLSFIPLDPYEELGWRIVIEGSQGLPEREFNGPVKGLQEIYTDGLAHLDVRAQGQGAACFAELSAQQRDTIINDTSDPEVQALVNVALFDTFNGMYGAPEYQGNKDLAGWGFTAWDGDVHPTGYTDEEVANADSPGPFDATLPPSYHENPSNGANSNNAAPSTSAAVAPKSRSTAVPLADPPASLPELPVMLSVDSMTSMVAECEGRLDKLREMMRPFREYAERQNAALTRAEGEQNA